MNVICKLYLSNDCGSLSSQAYTIPCSERGVCVCREKGRGEGGMDGGREKGRGGEGRMESETQCVFLYMYMLVNYKKYVAYT